MNYLFLFVLLLSCNIKEKQELPSLVNTKWEYKVADGCISYISFKANGTYKDYNCERDYPFSGEYELKEDTIYLIEIDLASDLPGENKTVVKGRSKYLLKENYLQYVSWEEYKNEKWTNVILSPNEIFYKKVDK